MPPDAQPARRSNPSGHLEIGIQSTGEQTTVTLAGELDIAAAPDVTTLMQGALNGSPAVKLDIEAVTFMDSAGLRCVLLCERLCRDAGVAFSLTPGSPRIRRLFAVAGLLDWLPAVDPGPGGGG
jgi:anti-sigma B factor antagonist